MGTRAAPDPATAEITYRLARTDDAERTYEIVQESQNDLNRKGGRPDGHVLPAERVIRFRHFCVRYDGDRFWVAEAGGRMIGAAYATLRDDVWYLDGLHVLTAFQARKVGSELIRRVMAGTGPGTALTVLTDASNPNSNGLYMRFGMLPQDSTVTFDGPVGAAPIHHPGFTARPIALDRDAAALAAFDLATVGFARPTDHEFWLGVPRLEGRILESEGSARGYLYASAGGAIGPVAVADPRDLEAALDLAAAISAGAGAATLHLRAFGTARGAADWSIRRGLKVSGIGLMLSSRPVGRFEGYVTSGADALY